MGDGATLTWSFVPDGTSIPGEGTSDLHRKLIAEHMLGLREQ